MKSSSIFNLLSSIFNLQSSIIRMGCTVLNYQVVSVLLPNPPGGGGETVLECGHCNFLTDFFMLRINRLHFKLFWNLILGPSDDCSSCFFFG